MRVFDAVNPEEVLRAVASVANRGTRRTKQRLCGAKRDIISITPYTI